MTIQELKDLVLLKISGQGNQIDIGGALPPVLDGILDILAATQSITQVIVTVDEGTGTPSAEASVADGVLTLNFHNLKGEKGEQGNTGSSVDYPFELVNNLITDDATKALSAKQGKMLNDELSQLGQEVNYKLFPLLSLPSEPFAIASNGTFIKGSSYEGYFIPVNGGETYAVIANAAKTAYLAFVKSKPTENGESADFATGVSARTSVSANTVSTGQVPSDAKFVYVAHRTGDAHNTPKALKIGGFHYLQGLPGAFDEIDGINSRVSDIVLVGSNTRLVSGDYYAFIPQRVYRFLLANPSWDISGLSSMSGGNNILYVTAHNVSGTQIGDALYARTKTNYPAPASFDVTIPVDTAFVRIAIRATDGEKVHFNVLDITDFAVRSEIPSYFQSNVASAISDSRRDMAGIGRAGENLIFVTDMHWEDNSKNSPALIGAICNELNVGNIVFGGDAINGEPDQDTAMAMFAEISGGLRKAMSQNFAAVMGNHDYNSADGGTAFINGSAVFYSIFNKNMDNVAKHGADIYYYFDNPTSNTRFIVLESATDYAISTAQEAWLAQVLSDTDATMNIIVFIHTYLKEQSQYDGDTKIGYDFVMSNAATTLQTAVDTAVGNGKKVQCVIAGHAHLDYHAMTAGAMVPIIGCDCDARRSFQWSSTQGTKNEQAFDIISIDYTNKVIRCRRVGRGKSRIIHYDKRTLSVNGTLDISSLLEVTPTSYSIRDNVSVQYRNEAGGGPIVKYPGTLATISDAGVVTAISSGLLMAVAENDDCIESFNIEVA